MKFSPILLPVATVMLLAISNAGYGQTKPAKKKVDPNKVDGSRTLKMVEAIQHWESLFNGKDLTGWAGDEKSYKVEDGAMVCQEGARNLETTKEYSDFVFNFEFRLTESGNSGIGLRVPTGEAASQGGMEIQILDHDGEKYTSKNEKGRTLTWLKPWQRHGSIYGVYPAHPTSYLKPVGEWNSETIICVEDHVKVIVNGATIVDVFLEDLTPVEASHAKGILSKKGHIVLAGHNDPTAFRNMRVADFSPSPTKPKTDADNAAPAGFTSFFNGKDLTGWKGLADRNALKRRALKGKDLAEAQKKADESMNEHWKVVDNILTYDGTGMSLCTSKDYGDFEMYLDYKIPPGADSGLYLRGTPQIQIWDPWDPRKKDGTLPTTADEWVTQYKNGRNLGSGSLWNNRRHSNRALVLADKRPGEWNTFLIRMVGDKVTIWLNDKLIVDRTVLENYWDKEGNRTAPLPRADQIELQHHGSELFFKNMYIREIPY